MEALQQQVQDSKENLEGTSSVLIQALSYLPGWNEKNFQVWVPSSNMHESSPSATAHDL